MRLARDGWKVAVHYSSDEAGAQETSRLLAIAASGVYRADLEHPKAAEELLEAAWADGALQAVINNAGIYIPLTFATASDEQFEENLRRTFAINFESPLRIARAAVRHFGDEDGGKILNVASRVGFKSEAGACLYAASKAALINLTRSLAVELAPNHIGVFGIAPGWVDTAMARAGVVTRIAEILPTIPLNRMASPEDCAAATAFLLSDEAAYLSGEVIDINGASYFH